MAIRSIVRRVVGVGGGLTLTGPDGGGSFLLGGSAPSLVGPDVDGLYWLTAGPPELVPDDVDPTLYVLTV